MTLGKSAFYYEEITTCYAQTEANETEDFYMDTFHTRDPRYGYNINRASVAM
jgi:hypothetical protein